LTSIWSRRFTALAIVSKKYERRPRTRRGVTYCLLINALSKGGSGNFLDEYASATTR
jgi:hypothetical protein